MKKLVFIFCFLLCANAFSQILSSSVEKKTIALGEVDHIIVTINNLNNEKVSAAPENELLPFHFEEVKDSISQTQDIYYRRIEFAVFEEGKFTIPELEFKVGGKVLKTIPYEIDVINTAQKDDPINDIMNNKEVKLEVTDYWQLYKFYILAAIAVIALIIAIIMFVKYGRKRKDSPVVATNQTLKELDSLQKKKYVETGNYRSFYVELIDISRKFIAKQYRLPADVLLTDDLVDLMKKNNTISQENERVVEDVFVRGDLVKFAKTFPDKETMEKDLADIREFVKRSSKDLEFENLRKDV
ncbi:BatD family protein [Chryseobacterium nepalense]|uniref:BatD family protein n=1 Tax=Chryseobacterium nepalense TaxID=1854498 RepID=A0ABY4K4F7_9FLAO|nr:BatD family protein [Chryseobacterium nepalense]MEC5171798.1 IS1 family transposase [Chryseobacterium nepalense]UPQ75597.1 BatD family protein [Chryseobacterium nepalense]